MPKLASSSVSRATMTVAAEAVIDSPTRRTADSTAACGVSPRCICSRTRNTKKSP